MEKEGCDSADRVAVGKRGQVVTESRGEGSMEGICFGLLYFWTFIRGGFEG